MRDGSVIVKMDKLSYGYMEAAYYWYEELVKVFVKIKCKISKKDKCVFIRHEEGKWLSAEPLWMTVCLCVQEMINGSMNSFLC